MTLAGAQLAPAAAATVVPALADSGTFHAVTAGTFFTLAGDLTGTYRLRGDTLDLDVARGLLYARAGQPGVTPQPHALVFVRPMFAACVANGTAHTWRRGRPAVGVLPVGDTLAVGDTLLIPPVHFAIAPAPRDSLGQRWVVFEVTERVPVTSANPKGLAMSYFHTSHTLFMPASPGC